MTSILLVDDEVDFHKPFSDSFKSEGKSEYNLILTATGLQGLRKTREIAEKENNLVLVVDLILPDFSGENLLEILNKENFAESKLKTIIISAHKPIGQLRKLQKKYSWVYDCFPKPIDTVYFKRVIDRLCGKPLNEFDYQLLAPDDAGYIAEQTRQIQIWMKQTALGAIEAGEKIIEIKKILGRGRFQDWVRLELGCHHGTALLLMNTAKVFGEEKERIANSGLGLSVVYLLAQNNTPPEMREKVLESSESGSPISMKEAKSLKKRYLQQQKSQTSPRKIEAVEEITSEGPATNLEIPTKVRSGSASAQSPISSQKQKILRVIPQEVATPPQPKNCWDVGRHLVFCGHPQEQDFIARLPEKVALTLAFPSSSNWNRETLIPRAEGSVMVFESGLNDADPNGLKRAIRNVIETYTEGGDSIIVSFLPDFINILGLVDYLGCSCLIAEPNQEKCWNMISKSGLVRNQNQT